MEAMQRQKKEQGQHTRQLIIDVTTRLFATRGSLVYDTTFFIPTFPQARATVSGFGAVFCDVDLDNSTLVELFDASDRLIFSRNVSNRDKGLSFLGASFTDGTQIGRVRVTTGNALFGSLDGVDDSGLFHDVVVLDEASVRAQFGGSHVDTPHLRAVTGREGKKE